MKYLFSIIKPIKITIHQPSIYKIFGLPSLWYELKIYRIINTKIIMLMRSLNNIKCFKFFASSFPFSQSLKIKKMISTGAIHIKICSKFRNKPNNKHMPIKIKTNIIVNNSLFFINCFIIQPPSFKVTF